MVAIVPPDRAAWTLDVEPCAHGVALLVGFVLDGRWTTVRLDMSRPDSRTLADEVLAAGGDGTMRTFAPAKRGRAPA